MSALVGKADLTVAHPDVRVLTQLGHGRLSQFVDVWWLAGGSVAVMMQITAGATHSHLICHRFRLMATDLAKNKGKQKKALLWE